MGKATFGYSLVILASDQHPNHTMRILALVHQNLELLSFHISVANGLDQLSSKVHMVAALETLASESITHYSRSSSLLESEESTSRTLSVCANRDPGINRNLLYYVFQNERKEGISNEEGYYRGLAVLRLDAKNSRLLGDYFTEQESSGQLTFKRQKEHAWWYPLR